jgi:hypothetical protein
MWDAKLARNGTTQAILRQVGSLHDIRFKGLVLEEMPG